MYHRIAGGWEYENDSVGRTKTVIQMTKEGDLINEYPSVIEASRMTGVPAKNISRAATGKTDTAGGFVWKY